LTETATEGALSVYAATGEVSAVAEDAYGVPDPQALTPFTAILAVPVPAVRLIASVVLDPLHPVPVMVQS
jgi:hypothetical protein